MRCFKVVLNTGAVFESAMTVGALKTTYTPGVRVPAPVGKVFVFLNQQQAEDWISPFGPPLEVWEAEAEGVETPTAVLEQPILQQYDAEVGATEYVNEYWTAGLYRQVGERLASKDKQTRSFGTTKLIMPPEGIAIADAVTLLRKVS